MFLLLFQGVGEGRATIHDEEEDVGMHSTCDW